MAEDAGRGLIVRARWHRIPEIDQTTALSNILYWLVNLARQYKFRVDCKQDMACWEKDGTKYRVRTHQDNVLAPVQVQVVVGRNSRRVNSVDRAVEILSEAMGIDGVEQKA